MGRDVELETSGCAQSQAEDLSREVRSALEAATTDIHDRGQRWRADAESRLDHLMHRMHTAHASVEALSR